MPGGVRTPNPRTFAGRPFEPGHAVVFANRTPQRRDRLRLDGEDGIRYVLETLWSYKTERGPKHIVRHQRREPVAVR